MNRKGDHPVNFVLIFVSMVLILLVSILVFIGIKRALFDDIPDGACAREIRAHATAVKFTEGTAAPTIKCPTRVLNLDTQDEVVVNKVLAEEMKRCWAQWGRGQYDLFGKDIDSREDGMYCHVCSMMYVEGIAETTSFPAFLDANMATKDLTYAQYLTGETTGTYFDQEPLKVPATIRIPLDEPVGVIFYYAKGQTGTERFVAKVLGTPAQGAIKGAAAGASVGAVTVFGLGLVAGTVGAPVVIGGFAATTIVMMTTSAGGAAGLWASVYEVPHLDTMSGVVARPLTSGQMLGLGCTYAPVSN
jgi:hypothetical protein